MMRVARSTMCAHVEPAVAGCARQPALADLRDGHHGIQERSLVPFRISSSSCRAPNLDLYNVTYSVCAVLATAVHESD